jgi:2-oxoglutarate ferredoxin oxidoreductase subunit alpha
METGNYRSIMGNQALSYGLIAASQKSGLQLFLGSYPITPASDILHDLSKYKNFGIKTFQAEDEIAAITSSIGASYGGSLAVTTTSGPGMALKAEAMGLAVMLEIPLIIINVQRGGPSTGKRVSRGPISLSPPGFRDTRTGRERVGACKKSSIG